MDLGVSCLDYNCAPLRGQRHELTVFDVRQIVHLGAVLLQVVTVGATFDLAAKRENLELFFRLALLGRLGHSTVLSQNCIRLLYVSWRPLHIDL